MKYSTIFNNTVNIRKSNMFGFRTMDLCPIPRCCKSIARSKSKRYSSVFGRKKILKAEQSKLAQKAGPFTNKFFMSLKSQNDPG